MITAINAREIQKKGVTQDEMIQRAVLRCNEAITDVARHRKETSVAVLIHKLAAESLEVVAEDVRERGFTVKSDYRDPDRSVLTIGWKE